MKTYRSTLLSLVMAVVLALAGAGLVGNAAPGPGAVPPGSAPGFYLVGSQSLSPALFNHAGDMQFFWWRYLNPAPGYYVWDRLDNYLATHAVDGKKVGVALVTYDGRSGSGSLATPPFVRDNPAVGYHGATTEESYNGGFELGLDGWPSSGPVSISTNPVFSGVNALKLGGTNGSTAIARQYTLHIPNVLADAQISYWWRMESSEDPGSGADTMRLELVEDGIVLRTIQSIDSAALRDTWSRHALDLSAYEGRAVELRFIVQNDGSAPTAFYIDDLLLTATPMMLKYWVPEYLQPYQAFVNALGARYRNDDRIAFVAMGTGMYGETRATDDEDDDASAVNGLTPELWIDTVNSITDFYIGAFTEGAALRKNLLLQMATYQFVPRERREFSEYAAQRGVGLSFNGLYPDTNVALACGRPGFDYNCAGAYDQLVAFNDLVPIGFETYSQMLPDPTAFYWGLLNAMDKKTDYIRMSPQTGWYLLPNGQPNLAYTDLMGWANRWLGKNLNDTPSVWVAMREHRNPIEYGSYGIIEYRSDYPQFGNYQFWLYQRNDVTGGRTVPETNQATTGGQPVGLGNCPGSPCFANAHNPALPDSAPEAWVIRRTDQATGNPFMFFSVDDGYMFGDEYRAEVRVTYWDHGTDRWQLKYRDSEGNEYAAVPEGSSNPWVQKGNSDQFATVTFVLSGASFANGMTGGTDFRIDSRGNTGAEDGDEWIHFVEVIRLEGPPPVPTRTRTPTPTPTFGPTRTPTPTWTPSSTPTATHTPSPSPSATATATDTPSPTQTPSPTDTPSPTATATATDTPSPTQTPSPTATATATPTHTPSPTATATRVPYGVLQGIIYHDVNDNAVYDPGVDLPLENAQLRLFNQANQQVGFWLTASNGLYAFSGLQPDRTYRLRETAPWGYAQAMVSDISLYVPAGTPISLDFGHQRYNLSYLPVLQKE